MTHTPLEDMTSRIRPRQVTALLLWVIVGFFALFLIWAMLTKLERTIHGTGRIVPTAQLQVVSNLEGGIVQEILVRPGTQVAAGTPLIRLDQTLTGAELGAGRSEYDALRIKLARLSAEVEGRQPQFPAASEPTTAEQVAVERALYLSRQSELSSLTAAGTARLAQAERAVGEAEANLGAAIAAKDAASQRVAALRPLVANGIEPRLSLVDAERQAAVAGSQVQSAVAALERARSGVAEARSTLAQSKQDWRAQAGQELATTQAAISAKVQALPALQDRVRRTIVRAPLAGRINRVLPTTVGGTVRPGEPLVEIVPADRGLTIETHVRPADIAFVRLGQRALVKVTAYDYSIYGGIEGKVIGISPDSVVEERTGDSYYTIRVRTTDTLKDANGQELPIGPGMLADVNLMGDKRTVMSYLLTPITRLSEGAFRER